MNSFPDNYYGTSLQWKDFIFPCFKIPYCLIIPLHHYLHFCLTCPFKVKITLITGWTLGLGPCGPNCSERDLRRSTRDSRNEMLQQHGRAYFGNWSFELNTRENGVEYQAALDDFNSKIVGEVAAVNEPMLWEQEIAEIITEIRPNIIYADIGYVEFSRNLDNAIVTI